MDLRQIVRATIDAEPERTDVDRIADEVLRQLAGPDRDEALRLTMREYVRLTFTATRRTSTPPAATPLLETATPIARPVVARIGRKQAAIRDAWRAQLDQWYSTPQPGGRARLRDLTYDEVQHNAALREQMASANATEAVQLRRLAALLIEHGAPRVGALPELALQDVLDREAAA
jgi:hypothetical protein